MFKKQIALGLFLAMPLMAGCTKNVENRFSLSIADKELNDCIPFQGNTVTAGPWKDSGTNVCVWDQKGTLVHHLIAKYLFPEPNGPMTLNEIGLLPKEKDSVYVLLAGDDDQLKKRICILEVIDMKNPSKHASISFDPQADVELDCQSSFEEGEIDVSNFTFDHPQFRFRVKHHDLQNYDTIKSVDQWREIQ